MTFSQIIVSQFAEPFRIVLLLGLVWTMMRTRAVSGTVIPLAAGVVFVAVLIPMTLTQDSPVPAQTQIGAGLVTNAILAGIILGIWELVTRLRGGKG
ncbi:hypothetical protein HOY34_14515 [Xinfangfangia sp. D13-10-4-6]|uniref:hypothetical protein n=1 Tax=Pseudogemmobacter hezensis TaxID=2737662 RepID=UPI001554E505|nr:hypothetical protein [Pseudogemmobacter hezensis]NPD16410.1 hypothetical protein [Pseudogemmobacter hezensis]